MRRVIRSMTEGIISAPDDVPGVPSDLVFFLNLAVHRCDVHPCVREGQQLVAGQPIAEGEWQVIHTSRAGRVRAVHPDRVEIDGLPEQPIRLNTPMPIADRNGLSSYFRDMGLAGMGGGCFPYARRFARTPEKPPHTLVINAVECEPGIGIDESLLQYQSEYVFSAVDAFIRLLDLKRCVLAVRRSACRHVKSVCEGREIDRLEVPDRYPGGAGKLITAKLSGRMPRAGSLNTDLGYVVSNVASLWAFGRRLLEGRPCVDRPLTLQTPDGICRQLIVPLGVSAGYVLNACGVMLNKASQVLVAEGRMMGHAAGPDYRVGKGTNALMVLPKESRWERAEQACILCGSCFDVCPLRLHPVGMAQRIREKQKSRALERQLNECFLCGACSAVCPADIPLVQIFREGKTWLKNNP